MKFKKYLNEEKKYKIYCDMDNVLVDFLKRANEISKQKLALTDWTTLPKKESWDIVASAGTEFWSEAQWMPDGKKLWNVIKKNTPIILSAYPKSANVKQYAIDGKKLWIKKNLGSQYVNTAIFCIWEDKQKYSGPKNILIDDLEKNINQWRAKGGIGILFKSYSQTMNDLKEYINKI